MLYCDMELNELAFKEVYAKNTYGSTDRSCQCITSNHVVNKSVTVAGREGGRERE